MFPPLIHYIALALFFPHPPTSEFFSLIFSLEILIFFISGTFLPNFSNSTSSLSLIVFLSHLPHLPLIPIQFYPTKQVSEVRPIWGSAVWLAWVPAWHGTYEKLGNISMFGTLRVLNGWWLRTPLFSWKPPLGHRVFKEVWLLPRSCVCVCLVGWVESSFGRALSACFQIPSNFCYSQWHQTKAAKPGAGAQSSRRRKARRRRRGLPRRRDGLGGQAHLVRRSLPQETKGKSRMMGNSFSLTDFCTLLKLWREYLFLCCVFHFFLRNYEFLDLYNRVIQSPFSPGTS